MDARDVAPDDARTLTAAAVKAEAKHAGFDLCGIAPAESFEELASLDGWLALGYAGDMAWMVRSAARRRDVRQVLPSARSVIVTGTVYNTEAAARAAAHASDRARISRYAWGADYHDVIGARLERLLAWMRSAHAASFDARVYVDTGPVQERVYAQHAGLGWMGKNTCLISPDLGSWMFLGVIITSLDLEPDRPGYDHCGSCRLCIEACPTGALVEPRVLDSRLCISYLTIEQRGAIDTSLLDGIGGHVYGCDVCQEVCPWNDRPLVSRDPEWQPRAGLDRASLVELWRLTDDELRGMLRGGPMTRAKVTGMRRNLAIAIGNAATVMPVGLLETAGDPDPLRPSLDDGGVKAAVRWAQARLSAGGAGNPRGSAAADPVTHNGQPRMMEP